MYYCCYPRRHFADGRKAKPGAHQASLAVGGDAAEADGRDDRPTSAPLLDDEHHAGPGGTSEDDEDGFHEDLLMSRLMEEGGAGAGAGGDGQGLEHGALQEGQLLESASEPQPPPPVEFASDQHRQQPFASSVAAVDLIPAMDKRQRHNHHPAHAPPPLIKMNKASTVVSPDDVSMTIVRISYACVVKFHCFHSFEFETRKLFHPSA
jgi:hypothetical protein